MCIKIPIQILHFQWIYWTNKSLKNKCKSIQWRCLNTLMICRTVPVSCCPLWERCMISPSPPAPAAAPSSAAPGTRSPCHSEESKHTRRSVWALAWGSLKRLEDRQTHVWAVDTQSVTGLIHPSQLRKKQIKRGADTEDKPCDAKSRKYRKITS